MPLRDQGHPTRLRRRTAKRMPRRPHPAVRHHQQPEVRSRRRQHPQRRLKRHHKGCQNRPQRPVPRSPPRSIRQRLLVPSHLVTRRRRQEIENPHRTKVRQRKFRRRRQHRPRQCRALDPLAFRSPRRNHRRRRQVASRQRRVQVKVALPARSPAARVEAHHQAAGFGRASLAVLWAERRRRLPQSFS